METVISSPEPFYPDRMGWYYRPSTDMYEFWWMGSEPKISLAAAMLEIMPWPIVREIHSAVMDKPHLTSSD